jgi:hypothetical protein
MFNTWDEVRELRDDLLQQTDWTQVSDVPDSVDRWSWQVYRHNLRNLPQKYSTPEEVVFPEPPPASQDVSDILGQNIE